MKLHLVPATAIGLALASPLQGQARSTAAASPDVSWRELAAGDLAAIHQALLANHPAIVVDVDSTEFRAWVQRGYDIATARLGQVDDPLSYYYLLKSYVGGFRDAHVTIWPATDVAGGFKPTWPGFLTRWLHGRYVVAPAAKVDQGLPAAGAVLVSCDGKPAEQFAKERLDIVGGNLALDSGKFRSATSLLIDVGNPFMPPPPKSCTFRANGRSRAYALIQRSIEPAEMKVAMDRARTIAKAVPGVAPWKRKGVWWIGLPSSFMGGDDWVRIMAEIEARRDEIRSGELVVVDARGTGGGSSSHAYKLARSLWGDGVVDAHMPKLGDAVWRVSAANREFLVKVRDLEAKAGSDQVAYYEGMIRQFDSALANGVQTIVEKAAERPVPTIPANPMKARVVVLTDYSCVSACLDFMDLFLAMPGVRQAGLPTDGDTIFMEADRVTLPSGKMLLDVPHKAWVQRPRGSNQVYEPAPPLRYHGDPSDDAAQKAWLSKVLDIS